MKRLLLSVFVGLGFLAAGCNTDIDLDELNMNAKLSAEDLCILSGGEYKSNKNLETGNMESFCYCGETKCGQNVNCRLNEAGQEPTCGGIGFTFLTEGLCTMNGVEVCSERIGLDGQAHGYFTKCENNRWTDEATCVGQNSCEVYMFGGFAMSSRCGECINDGVTCIGGKKTN